MSRLREREVARRAFAAELTDAVHTYRTEDDDQAPIYALLPTGERANRVLIAGTLLATSEFSSDGGGSIWGMELKDPTGEMTAYASPDSDASGRVPELSTPEYVALTAKPRTHEDETGTQSVGLRAETLSVITPETYDHWIADTAEKTLARISDFDVSHPPAQRTTDEYQSQPVDYSEVVVTALDHLD